MPDKKFDPADCLESPPDGVAEAFDQILKDHILLADFLWGNQGATRHLVGRDVTHGEVHQMAKAGINKDTSLVTLWLQRFTRAMKEEVIELDESIPWKWWRGQTTDLQNVRVELVDIFHFLMSAAFVSGMTGKDFIELYYQKRKLNADRQRFGFRPDDNKGLTIKGS